MSEPYQAIFYLVDPKTDKVVLSSDLVKSATYTIGHGITPGTISAKLWPQAGFVEQEVNAVFEDTEGYSLVLRNCKIDSMIMASGPDGQYWNLALLDRRWKWRFGQVSQMANLYNPDRTLIAQTQITPYYLAALCLQAMQEVEYQTGVLLQFNGKSYPTCKWDYENAAHALEGLCDQLGCRVTFDPYEDQVVLVQLGFGLPLAGADDSDDAVEDSSTVDPPETPSAIASVGAFIEIQADLPLRAVGINVDGDIVPLSEVDYAPEVGWGEGDIVNFSDLSILTPATINLAKMCAFRWYQIDPTQLSSIKIPNPYWNPSAGNLTAMGSDPNMGSPPTGQWLTLTSLDQILPLLNTQIACVNQNVFGQGGTVANFRLDPWVYGQFFLGKLEEQNDNSINNIIQFQAMGPSLDFANDVRKYTGSFSTDTRLGIVKFSMPVFAIDETVASTGMVRTFANLALRISFNLKSPETLVEQRHQWAQVTNTPYTTPTQYEKHEDLKRQIIVNYNNGSSDLTPNDTTDNIASVNNQAATYNAAILASYQNLAPQQVTYRRLMEDMKTDGAIRQVTINVSDDGGAQTMATRNTDSHPVGIPYQQSRWERQVSTLLRRTALSDLDAELRQRRANKDGD